MRKGILGGTFDPVHMAHLVIAEEALVRLGLDEVVFIPTGQPWLKADQPVSPAGLRLEMVRLAIADNKSFRLSSVEVERTGPTYSVDTLEELSAKWGEGVEIFFILGIDALKDLPKWKKPARVLDLCTPVVFSRPEHESMPLNELDAAVPGASNKVRFLSDPKLEISGTDIRKRVARGETVRYLVPESVERFIREHNLYC